MREDDVDGYPTGEELEYITKFDVLKKAGPHVDDNFAELMAYIKARWHWPSYFTEEGGMYRLATGGWSGNEDLLSALRSNALVHLLYWQSSHRGGLVYYRKYHSTEGGE